MKVTAAAGPQVKTAVTTTSRARSLSAGAETMSFKKGGVRSASKMKTETHRMDVYEIDWLSERKASARTRPHRTHCSGWRVALSSALFFPGTISWSESCSGCE